MNLYPEPSAGRPPIASERPVAGEYQAGCLPVTGSRRLSCQDAVCPMIPFGPTGTGSINGTAADAEFAAGAALEVAGVG